MSTGPPQEVQGLLTGRIHESNLCEVFVTHNLPSLVDFDATVGLITRKNSFISGFGRLRPGASFRVLIFQHQSEVKRCMDISLDFRWLTMAVTLYLGFLLCRPACPL
ncbi:hypothetical protein CRM22_006528 [Opisthorchis felineus]|uniref:Uncharacterized protein n=1 Tax=Opisthorchis felineus TaxID=147828 RepID=A0A4S2LSQ7_OPIFE|nr:hypothetical protein CRM22_006528 [Opisthorchis felineus]